MSNIYILEPPTSGKVLMKTTVGDIDVELWTKEAPKACRNFIQLCMEGYYNNTVFHRVVKGFIAQGGDPLGDGTGGESVYGEPFKDEFHQRLKFVRRGLLAMANAGKDDNGSQFFFTLAATPELQNLHTIFGKVSGETVFNMLKLEEGLIEGERPVYPHKILKTEVLLNPFGDIAPRIKEAKVERKKKKERAPGVKNFKLLSFGAEAEEDEAETSQIVNEQFAGKAKSTHDVLDDPKLSSKTEETAQEEHESIPTTDDIDPEEQLENIRKKLKTDKVGKPRVASTSISHTYNDDDEFDDDEDDEKKKERRKKFEEIKKEIENVKKEYHKNKLKKNAVVEEEKEEAKGSETFQEYKIEYDKYKDRKRGLPKKGAGREEFTLGMLAKFKERLNDVKEKSGEDKEGGGGVADKEETEPDDVDNDESWMSHTLRFKSDDDPVLAKDANTKDDDWFEIYDPRSTINKRRRGEEPQKLKRK